VILAKHRRPRVCPFNKPLPLLHDALQLRQLPLLEKELVIPTLTEVDNVELEHHTQLSIAGPHVLEHLLRVWRVRELSDRHRCVVVVEHLPVHLAQELVDPRTIGPMIPRRLLEEPCVDDGRIGISWVLGVPWQCERLVTSNARRHR
jgi:hypothetical protein